MKMIFKTLAVLAALVPFSVAQAQTAPHAMIRLHETGKAAAAATLTHVAWLVGSWVGNMEGVTVEHLMLPGRLGQIPGFVRATGGTEIVFYEITTFVENGGSVSYRVKHFTPALAGWEAQNAYVDRPLIQRDDNSLYFDGITFTRTGADSFTVYFFDANRKVTLTIPFKRMAVKAS